jgi:hypothetical protein
MKMIFFKLVFLLADSDTTFGAELRRVAVKSSLRHLFYSATAMKRGISLMISGRAGIEMDSRLQENVKIA